MRLLHLYVLFYAFAFELCNKRWTKIGSENYDKGMRRQVTKSSIIDKK